MSRRSKLEVFMDIMKVVAEEREAKRTRIMYRANLAWNVLKESLDTLERIGVLTSEDTPAGLVVHSTENGLELLNKYCAVESVFAEPTAQAEGLKYPTSRMTILH
jgi:predicted transcriptional regulator